MMYQYYVNAGTIRKKVSAACAVDACIKVIREAMTILGERDICLPKYIILHERGFRDSVADYRHDDLHYPVQISSEFIVSELCRGR